ncbi:LAFA_0G15764g1_1 [Lachancea sp. 'fantastica']|nr:LAFA_0G15764g1_1 [Lachancea sp. 'fantastica']
MNNGVVDPDDAIIVNQGNANILVRYGDRKSRLDRCCVRFRSLEQNNTYTLKNLQFVKNCVVPLLGDYLVAVTRFQRSVLDLRNLLTEFKVDVDSQKVEVLEMENLTYDMDSVVRVDHFTKFHRCKISEHCETIVWEFKPKWMTEKGENCRNCSLNCFKGRNIPYCYNMVLERPSILRKWLAAFDVPSQFFDDMELYFSGPDNVLATIYGAQSKLVDFVSPPGELTGENDVSEKLALLMTLRDVTCFLRWDPASGISAKIVDVDLKPKSKWKQWKDQQDVLDASHVRVCH